MRSSFKPWLRPGMVARLYVADLQAVDWGEGPRALVTQIKATEVGVIFLNEMSDSVRAKDLSQNIDEEAKILFFIK